MISNTRGPRLSKSVAAFMFIQGGIAFGSVYLAAELRFLFDPEINAYLEDLWPSALTFAAMTVLGLASIGLYRQQLRGNLSQVLQQIAFGIVIAMIGTALIFYLIPSIYIGRGVISLAMLLTFLGAICSQLIFLKLLDHEAFKQRVLMYGAGQNAQALMERLQRKSDQRRFHIVGFVPVSGESACIPEDHHIHADETDLVNLAQRERVDEIVIVMDEKRNQLPLEQLLTLKFSGLKIRNASDFYEHYMGKLKVDLMPPSSLIFASGFERNNREEILKRMLDIGVSTTMLVLLWPIMLLTAFAIRLEDGWRAPILYRQTRVGRYETPFKVLKFRSMRPNAEADGKARWATTNDNRITRVGGFIRKYRIDELPQLFNVLAGQMSLVGPRPERPEFVARLSQNIPYYNLRHNVRPGVTGWAQISYPYGATERDALEKLQYDLYYVKYANLLFDLYILLGTVEVILMRKGGR